MIDWTLELGEVRRGPDGFIKQVWYRVTGTDAAAEREQACQGSVEYHPPEDDAEFVPFDDLSVPDIIAWIEETPEVAHSKVCIIQEFARVDEPMDEIVPPPGAPVPDPPPEPEPE